MPRNRVIAIVVGLVTAGLLSVATVFISVAMRTAKDMSDTEVRSHTTVMMATVTARFMRDHNGRWPASWDDLRPYSAEWGGVRFWPDGEEKIRQDVAIDFDADPAKFSDDPAVAFIAIRPKGDSYGSVVWDARWWVIEGWREIQPTEATISP